MDKERLNICVKNAKKGDASAFGELYEAFAEELYRFALWYLRDPDDAQDAVQTCALNAYRNIAAVRTAESFRPWLFRILANACADLFRSKRKQVVIPLEEVQTPSWDDYQDGSVLRLLDRLDETDRQIVTLAVLGDWNSTEIAHLLGGKPATVRSRLSRSLKKLRDAYEA